jgi:Tol biopolymer transport system component
MKTPALTSSLRARFASLALALAATVVVAAPAQAAFPGNPGPIAYSHGFTSETEEVGGIVAHGPRKSQAARPLTHDRGDGTPAYSANGRMIAFSGNREPSTPTGPYVTHIYVMNADGSGVRALTSDESRDSNPSFSPDGRRLVFDRVVGSGNFRIFSVNVDGTGLRPLTDGSADDYDPTFAPNGRWIAFTSNRDHDVRTDRSDIFSMRADGSHQRILIDGPRNESEPDISPDGRSIAFVSNRDGGNNIFVARSNGRHPRALTHSPECFHRQCFLSPAWAPDGRHIAYLSSSRYGTDLLVMRSDGTHATEFAEAGTEEEGYGSSVGAPSWGVRAR